MPASRLVAPNQYESVRTDAFATAINTAHAVQNIANVSSHLFAVLGFVRDVRNTKRTQ